jgi:predicted RNase H-like nuclease (RuvC/YqgF family)
MPCTDGGGYDSRSETRELREKVDMLTDLLCNLCYHLEKSGHELDPHTTKWWTLHKQQDEDRKREEMLQREKQILYKKRQIAELNKELEELAGDKL